MRPAQCDVQRRSWPQSRSRYKRCARSSCNPLVALASPKSITLGTGVAVVGLDQDVRGLEVAVDDPLLMGVLHGRADLAKERQSLGSETHAGRNIGERNSLDLSITKNGRPASVEPASRTFAMLG